MIYQMVGPCMIRAFFDKGRVYFMNLANQDRKLFSANEALELADFFAKVARVLHEEKAKKP